MSEHYQFPRRYLPIVEKCIDDWIVLRRPRADGGNLAYFAVARVATIESDPQDPTLSYARLIEFLPFDGPVPWKLEGQYAEAALRNIPQQQVGVYLRGRSVRPLSDSDFDNLVIAGFRETFDPRNAERLGLSEATLDYTVLLPDGRDRQIKSQLTNRVVREASFSRAVYGAYDNRCAVSRLQIFDAVGNSEVHAAHIWGVAEGGPDVVQNGIALSGTFHWLFDRFLFSISDDYRLLFVEKVIPGEVREVFERYNGKISLPANPKDWPHPKYLAKHRAILSIEEQPDANDS